MKMKNIRTKMLVFILPVVILAMFLLTLVSVESSRRIIYNQIAKEMKSELTAQNQTILNKLENVSETARSLSFMVGTTYQDLDLPKYEEMLSKVTLSNDLILGSGIWFEPNMYDSAQKYVGPYVYRDGENLVTTYDYSNAEYDYHNQEYYTITKGATEPIITDPYYDATSGMIMSSCAMPIYDKNNKFLGCVTVDMELTSIQNIVNSVKVGQNGKAFLLTGSGVYLSFEDDAKVANAALITDDENKSLAKAGEQILSNENGMTTYEKNGEKYELYYATIEGVNWKLIIEMPKSEINQPINKLITDLVIICIIAVFMAMISVLLQVYSIAKNIKRVQVFAGFLAEGNFSIEPLPVKTIDELGQMGNSLNEMYDSNKKVIMNISEHARDIDSASGSLNHSSMLLSQQFGNIEKYMMQVNEAMMATSAATEEVNASTEEVDAYVSVLTQETEQSKKMTNDISVRASRIQQKSRESYDYATQLSKKYEAELGASIEHVEVVENIVEMADMISGIAEQINLLSLNASIEAARAGEHGRGFAVVASEIGKLANDTSTAVDRIQNTILQVKDAVESLTSGSQSLLQFVQSTVTPDYNSFVEVAKQYGNDAQSMEEVSQKISDMSKNINKIMNEVSEAIQNIAESAQTTADSSAKTLDSVSEVGVVVDEVSEMSEKQKHIVSDLNDMVNRFRLS